MLGHGKRSSSMMHATPTEGTKTPTHARPSHQTMAGVPGAMPLDHPAGGGDMPLPQGGPGGQPMHMAAPHMPVMHSGPKLPKIGGKPSGRKLPPGY